MNSYSPGDRVIYTRLQRPANTEWPATYVRAKSVNGNPRHVIVLDATPGKPCTVGDKSIRSAT